MNFNAANISLCMCIVLPSLSLAFPQTWKDCSCDRVRELTCIWGWCDKTLERPPIYPLKIPESHQTKGIKAPLLQRLRNQKSILNKRTSRALFLKTTSRFFIDSFFEIENHNELIFIFEIFHVKCPVEINDC